MVTFEITKDKLAYLGRDLTYRIDAGDFEFMVGASSDDLQKVKYTRK